MKPPKPNLLRIFLGEWKRLWAPRSRKEISDTVDCLNSLDNPSEYETSAKTELLQINLANQLPLNQAAAQFMSPEWMDKWAELHVLSLMRWGLENGLGHWLEEMARIQKGPTPERVEARINRLTQMEPKKTMQFLTDPENTGDVMLNAEDLLKQENPLDAASLLLETLYDAMVATAP